MRNIYKERIQGMGEVRERVAEEVETRQRRDEAPTEVAAVSTEKN